MDTFDACKEPLPALDRKCVQQPHSTELKAARRPYRPSDKQMISDKCTNR
jgi:hypothetical protein